MKDSVRSGEGWFGWIVKTGFILATLYYVLTLLREVTARPGGLTFIVGVNVGIVAMIFLQKERR
jgi:hypothetical protein